MSIFDLTPRQLKRAAAIREEIDRLNTELRRLLGESPAAKTAPRKKRRMSAAIKKKIAAAQRARWAKLRASPKSR